MTALDRLLQRWRIARAAAWLPGTPRLLDVGCADGALFRQLGIRSGLGIDPLLREPSAIGDVRLVPGEFPSGLPSDCGEFDVITMLAVLEHVAPPRQSALAQACQGLLRKGGLLILTVPSPAVDRILAWLRRLRLAHGMSLEEHYGFRPEATVSLFQSAGFRLRHHGRFQLGLNHLFVFERKVSSRSEGGGS